jgi:hypothetical protein
MFLQIHTLSFGLEKMIVNKLLRIQNILWVSSLSLIFQISKLCHSNIGNFLKTWKPTSSIWKPKYDSV